MKASLVLHALASVSCLSASTLAQSQLFLSTSAPSSSPAKTPAHGPVSLSAPQANAVIAHHLGVAQFEHLPTDQSGDDVHWQDALSGQWSDQVGPKMVVILECGKHGCDGLVPESLGAPYLLPSLPIRSWTSLLTLHLHRLAGSLGLDTSNPTLVWGLDSLVTALKSVDGWAGWVGHELGNAIGWDQIKKTVKAAVEPIKTNYRLLTELDFVDEGSDLLMADLQSLSALVDSFAPSASAIADDSAAQVSAPHIVALHLKGMKAVADLHSPASPAYERAATLFRSTLAATLAAFHAAEATSDGPAPTVLLLALPPYSPPLLRKRTPWLKPFASLSKRYSGVTRPSSALAKRAFGDDDASDSEGRVQQTARPTPSPVVPTGYVCFESEKDLKNQTLACLGRGTAVKGVTIKGTECWVCSCGKTTENGKTRSWGGQGCEKEDLSSDFVLLFFSAAGLFIVLLGLIGGYNARPGGASELCELEILLARGKAYESIIQRGREILEHSSSLLRWAREQEGWSGDLGQAWAREDARAAEEVKQQQQQQLANRATLEQRLQPPLTPFDISVPVRIFVQSTKDDKIVSQSSGDFWLVFRRAKLRASPSLILSTTRDGTGSPTTCFGTDTTLNRILTPAPEDSPLCLVMSIIRDRDGEEHRIRAAFHQRHPSFNRSFTHLLCKELAALPTVVNAVTMPLGAQLHRLRGIESSQQGVGRGHLTVLSLPISLWSHGKNLSKQHRHGRTYRLFYVDQLDPSVPLVFLEEVPGKVPGKVDPIAIQRGEIISVKLPPVGREAVFELNCAPKESDHFVFKIVLLRLKLNTDHPTFSLDDFREFERRISLLLPKDKSAKELQGVALIFDQEVSPGGQYTVTVRVDDRVVLRYNTIDGAIKSVGLSMPREDGLILRFEVETAAKLARLDCILDLRSALYVHASLTKVYERFRNPILADFGVRNVGVSLYSQLASINAAEVALRGHRVKMPAETRLLQFDLFGLAQQDGKIKTTANRDPLSLFMQNKTYYLGTPATMITLRFSDLHQIQAGSLRRVLVLELVADKRSELANAGLGSFFPDLKREKLSVIWPASDLLHIP
ncbi:hypothetical protein RQP46_003942 [Phenoliferia psychrophenolica]